MYGSLKIKKNYEVIIINWGHAVAYWLTHCATTQTVAGSMASWQFSIDNNPSGRTMALVSTHPVTEMSTNNTSWG